jgi:hypothetical protein
MRPLLFVAVLLIVATIVAGVRLVDSDAELGPPDTDAEQIATSFAQAYARALNVGDAEVACLMAVEAAAEANRCETAEPRVQTCGSLSNPLADVNGARARVRIGVCTLELVAFGDGEWKVVEEGRPSARGDRSARAGGDRTTRPRSGRVSRS